MFWCRGAAVTSATKKRGILQRPTGTERPRNLFVDSAGLSLTPLAWLLVRRFDGRIGKKMLKNKLYLLIQRPMFPFCEIGKPLLELFTKPEQKCNPSF